jgi:hypothetical protein
MKRDILYLAVITVIVIFFGVKDCSRDSGGNIEVQKDTAMLREVRGIMAAWNNATVLETQGQLKLLIASNDTLKKMVSEFKRVQSTLVIKQETRIKDSIHFKEGDSIPCDFPPVAVEKTTANYSFKGSITNKALFIDDLFIPNKQSIVLGDKKTSFWGNTERQVSVVNSNPLVSTGSIQNFTIKEKKKWWERPVIVAPLGFVAGTAIVKTIQILTIKK